MSKSEAEGRSENELDESGKPSVSRRSLLVGSAGLTLGALASNPG